MAPLDVRQELQKHTMAQEKAWALTTRSPGQPTKGRIPDAIFGLLATRRLVTQAGKVVWCLVNPKTNDTMFLLA